jgi:hypothetical protein
MRTFSASLSYGAPEASPSCLSRSGTGIPGEPVTLSVPRTVRGPGSMLKISVVV